VKLTYHIAVQHEVDEACQWYDERKDKLGDEFFNEVVRILGLIEANPQAFPPAPFCRRKARLKRFPYSICYRIHAEKVRILSVCHDKRHSFLWQWPEVTLRTAIWEWNGLCTPRFRARISGTVSPARASL